MAGGTYDRDSYPIHKELTEAEKEYYLDNVTLEKANLSIVYMENALVDPGLSRRLLFRPRGNTGGPRLSEALDGYVAANLYL